MKILSRTLFASYLAISAAMSAQQPTIQSIQTALDPPNGSIQNVRITVLFGAPIPANGSAQIALKSIDTNRNAKPIDAPAATPLPDNPTGVSFLVPLTSLAAGADQLSYQVSLKIADQTQITPELRLALAPIANSQQQALQLTQQINQLQAQILALKQQKDAALQAYVGGLPDTPIFVAKRFKSSDTATSVLVQFSTNKPGELHASLLHSGDDVVVDEHTETQPTVTHTFEFANAVPGSQYYVAAAIVDPKSGKDVKQKTISGSGDPKLRFTMQLPNGKPVISNLKPGQLTSSSMSFSFDLASASSLQVTCLHIPDPTLPGQQEKVATPAAFSLDAFGLPSSSSVDGHKQFTCDKLQPEQSYIAQVEAYNDFDQSLPPGQTVEAKTPTKLAFDGPVKITLSAAGMQVAWNAKGSGTTGTITFVTGSNKVNFDVEPKGQSFSTTFSPDKLSQAFQVDPTTKTLAQAPTLTASMTDGTDKVETSFSVSVNVAASKNSVQQLAKTSNADPDSLSKVADGVQNPSKTKFSWQQLLQTGLGMIIKLI